MENEKSLMSRLYEMQDTYAFEQTSIDNTIPHCIINANKRTITVPEEIKSLGVQYDHRSNIVVFEIDRYIDEVDLLTQTCIIQWMNFNNTKENVGLYPVTSIDSSVEGKLIFTWKIHNESTQLPGTIAFAVRFYSMQDENSFLWSYNTLPAQSTILDTLDVVVRSSTEIEPSILMAWTERMAQLEQIARDAINVSSQSAKEAEAWAHGRADYPSLALDNAKYYAEMAKAVYEDAKGSVAEELDGMIEEVESVKNDCIEDLTAATDDAIQRVNDSTSSVVEEIESVGEELVSEIQQYGTVQVSTEEPTSEHVDVWIKPDEEQEVLIPEIKDNEINEEDTWSSKKINDELEKLSISSANTIVQTKTGCSIVANDSSNDPLRGLRVFGKTEQFTTTGKNMIEVTATSKTVNGVTFTVNGDGSITANGTATAEAPLVLNTKLSLKSNTAYILNGCPSGGSTSTYYLNVGYIGEDTGTGKSKTVTQDVSGVYTHIFVKEGTTVNNLVFKPMLRLATVTDDTFEPYTGGIPSPNPQYPQELVSVGDDGDVEVGVYGGNLFDANSLKLGNNKTLNVSDDEYTITCTGGADGAYRYSAIDLNVDELRGHTFYLSTDSIVSSSSAGMIQLVVHYDNAATQYRATRNGESVIVQQVSDHVTRLMLGIYTNNDSTALATDNTITIKGLRVTLANNVAWTSYKSPQSLTALTPNGLPGIKLGAIIPDVIANSAIHMSGVYWNEDDDNYYIADTIDFDRGVYVKRIGEVKSNEWDTANIESSTTGHRFRAMVPMLVVKHIPCVCTHYTQLELASYGKEGDYIATDETTSGRIQIRTLSRDFSTIGEFRAFVEEEDMKVYYILATPIETPLSASELAQYRALHTNYPTTTILNDSGAHMELRYNADTQNYIAQNFVPLTKYNELETRLAAIEASLVNN